MPILPTHLAYGPKGTVFAGPVIGGLFTLNITLPVITGAITTGNALSGVVVPCDARLMQFNWAAEGARTGTNTLALFKHSAVAGATGGTAVMAATSVNATIGTVEGAGFASSAARDFTKGQVIAVDVILAAAQTLGATDEPCTLTFTFMSTGYPLADMSAV